MSHPGLGTRKYVPKQVRAKQGPNGAALCHQCRAIYRAKRWFFDEELYVRLSKTKEAAARQCPGCKAIEEKMAEGQIEVQWPSLKHHRDEMLHLIRHEAAKDQEKNALSRIVDIDLHPSRLEVYTTTRFLATRIGHALEGAFHGRLEIHPSPQEAFVRVRWSRED